MQFSEQAEEMHSLAMEVEERRRMEDEERATRKATRTRYAVCDECGLRYEFAPDYDCPECSGE